MATTEHERTDRQPGYVESNLYSLKVELGFKQPLWLVDYYMKSAHLASEIIGKLIMTLRGQRPHKKGAEPTGCFLLSRMSQMSK